MVLGNGRLESEVENLTGRRMTAKKMGRPVGWRKKKADQ
jgi:putative transposase